jgi:hypothetical protein
VITWAFWDPVGTNWLTTKKQQDVVKQAWQKWINSGINLKIKQVTNRSRAMIRIAFGQPDAEGSFSYVGNVNMRIAKSTYTMHFGWDLTRQPGTAEHEIGHALGFDHEHQHPLCKLEWDRDDVLAHFEQTQGWGPKKVEQQVLNRVQGPYVGLDWNPQSIMHYPFPARLINAPPEQHRNGIPDNTEIHALDFAAALLMYPPTGTPSGVAGSASKAAKKRKAAEAAPVILDEMKPWEPKEVTTEAGKEIVWALVVEEGGSFSIKVLGDTEVLTVVHAHIGEETQQLAAGILSEAKSLPLTLVAHADIEYHVTMRIVHNSTKVFAVLTQK